MDADAIVVGAGVAGLACARGLAAAGRTVKVLDRARGVGGRCATHRHEGHPIDFGPLFLHGHVPAFLDAVDAAVGDVVLAGWPRRVRGQGQPCQPDAFRPDERRFALRGGLSAFPKRLADGLDVTLRTSVSAVRHTGDGIEVRADDGRRWRGRDLVVAMALEQALALTAGLPDDREMRAARALLTMFASHPTLALLAVYPADTPDPGFDVWYPEDSDRLTLLADDTSKVRSPPFRAMIYQAKPRWSRAHAEEPPAVWASTLLAEAAERLGSWAASPRWKRTHRWRFGRVDRGNELAAPIRVPLGGGARLGLAGDVFAPGGGVQAAWLSGDQLARRLTEEEAS